MEDYSEFYIELVTMRPIYKMNVIQIEITNACIHQCANCTRFCGHHKKPFFMDLATFEQAVDSMKGFDGMLGIMGGEPTLHPEFELLLDIYSEKWHPQAPLQNAREPIRNFNEYIIENGLQNWTSKRGLWTCLGAKYYEHFEAIQDIFEFQLVNDHSNPGLHQSMLISRKELGVSDEEWIPLRDQCWVQNSWSASITPKGAFFCEVAAALDMLFDGPGGWPIEKDWWRREPREFGKQLDWCELCGACLNVPRVPANTETDVVSPKLYAGLEEIGSPKLKRGKVSIFEPKKLQQKGVSYSSEWYLPKGDNTKRISPSNNSLLPKTIEAVKLSDNPPALPEHAKDWLLIQDLAAAELKAFTELFQRWIFNRGCLYLFTEPDVIAFNVNAKAIRKAYPRILATAENWRQQLRQLWPPDKVVQLEKLQEPGNIQEKLDRLSEAEREKTRLMTTHILNTWRDLAKNHAKLVLFGCGQHTTWLLEQLHSHQLALPKLIIDDAPHMDQIDSIPVISTKSFVPADYDTLVISSDIHANKMTQVANGRWQGEIAIINMYSTFDDPYFQK